MKRLKYAMVGGGKGSFIGPVHRAAIRMDDLADIVAGCFTRDAEANSATASELGVAPDRVYADWQSLIAAEKGRIDFIAVCTPNDSHYAIAKAALEAGMNVMCEKPLSVTAAEAIDLEKLARRKRRILGVPFTYSGYPMVKLARDLVKNGELGRICKESDPDFYAPLAEALMVELLYRSAQSVQTETSESEDSFLREVVAYIDEHLCEKILLDDLALRTAHSKSSLCHLFRSKMNVSPKQYILQKKMALAEQLIRDGMPPTAAALRVGYENYSNFYRLYTKLYGANPTAHIREKV